MRRVIFVFLLAVFLCHTGHAQTHLKANALCWMAMMPNVSVETKLFEHFTLSGELFYSPWKSIHGNPFQFLQFTPDMRWYPRGAFRGFYLGAFISVQDFKITKFNYWNTDYYQKGWSYCYGGMIGFQTMLTDKWGLDVYAGGGYDEAKYHGYRKTTDELIIGWNGSGELIPYRVGITVCYRL